MTVPNAALWQQLSTASAALTNALSETEIGHIVAAHLRDALRTEAICIVALDSTEPRCVAMASDDQFDWRALYDKARGQVGGCLLQTIHFNEKPIGAIALCVHEKPSVDALNFLHVMSDLCGAAWWRMRAIAAPNEKRAISIAEETRLLDLFVHAPARICILRGKELRVVFANDTAIATFGTNPVGKTIFEIFPDLLVPDQNRLIEQVFEAARPFRVEELEVTMRKDEPASFYDLFVRPFFGADGKVEGLVAFAADISEVVRTRRAVEEMVQKARIVDQRKDEFLAMLGHELRNPLGPARTALVLARNAIEKGESATNYFQVVERQVNNLARLVDDLLDVSRITRGKVVLRRERVDARDAVRRVLDALRPALEQQKRTLSVQITTKPAPIFVDQTRLEQVLSNLLSNALKFTSVNQHISVAVSVDKEVVIEVSDNGIGIAPEVLPLIFELFEQAERGLDRAQGGLGIGLTVVRTLVEQHGGRVEAKSEGLGKGATFFVRLPLFEEIGASVAASTPAALQMAKHRLLVVDDSADGAEMLALLLRSWGHDVDVARDGPSALNAIAKDCPDLVLLDIGLPGMDGYEVARRVRAAHIAGTPQPKLVALTGYGQDSDRKEALAAGFDEHLVKPVDFAKLREVIAAS